MTSPRQIERERGIKEAGQQLAVLRERWPLAFPVQAQDVRPLAMGVANQIAETMGWSLSYSVGVLTYRKMAAVYCRAVLAHDQRVTLDGRPVEAVDEGAKDLAAKGNRKCDISNGRSLGDAGFTAVAGILALSGPGPPLRNFPIERSHAFRFRHGRNANPRGTGEARTARIVARYLHKARWRERPTGAATTDARDHGHIGRPRGGRGDGGRPCRGRGGRDCHSRSQGTSRHGSRESIFWNFFPEIRTSGNTASSDCSSRM
jgi:hypothetical protein